MNAILLTIGLLKLTYIFERGTIACEAILCEIFVYNFLLNVLLISRAYI